jgi:hypothetical protein
MLRNGRIIALTKALAFLHQPVILLYASVQLSLNGVSAHGGLPEGTGMALNVCPWDRVQAPVEVVWELLMHPAGYGGFWEMKVERVEPTQSALSLIPYFR